MSLATLSTFYNARGVAKNRVDRVWRMVEKPAETQDKVCDGPSHTTQK